MGMKEWRMKDGGEERKMCLKRGEKKKRGREEREMG